MSKSLIRDLQELDLERAFQINQENVPAVGHESLESFRMLWSLSDLALVLEIEGQVEGFCILMSPLSAYQSPNFLYFKSRYTSFTYLDRIALSASAQGQGFGVRLYDKIQERINSEHLTLEVNVVPPNEGSLRFHLREGFKEIEQRETRPGKVVSLMHKIPL